MITGPSGSNGWWPSSWRMCRGRGLADRMSGLGSAWLCRWTSNRWWSGARSRRPVVVRRTLSRRYSLSGFIIFTANWGRGPEKTHERDVILRYILISERTNFERTNFECEDRIYARTYNLTWPNLAMPGDFNRTWFFESNLKWFVSSKFLCNYNMDFKTSVTANR